MQCLNQDELQTRGLHIPLVFSIHIKLK